MEMMWRWDSFLDANSINRKERHGIDETQGEWKENGRLYNDSRSGEGTRSFLLFWTDAFSESKYPIS